MGDAGSVTVLRVPLIEVPAADSMEPLQSLTSSGSVGETNQLLRWDTEPTEVAIHRHLRELVLDIIACE